MKKLIAAVLIAVMALSLLAGCANTAKKEDGVYHIAIVQQLDHSSMDEIRLAVEKRLEELAGEKKITVEFKDFNGQNDASMLNQMSSQIVSSGFDAVIPIGTLAAQCMVSAEMGLPIIYSAVSDPKVSGLTGLSKVTGVSDALNTPFILDMMLALDPEIKTVGLLYSNSEPNSATPIAQAREYLKGKGIAFIEKTGNNAGEIIAAAESLTGRVSAVFTPTDNVVMASESAISEIFSAAGIAHYTGADSFVTSGAFATCGVNYTELGARTAELAVDCLLSGNYPEFIVMDGGIITVNTDIAAALKLDYSPFAKMAGTVKEVKTGK